MISKTRKPTHPRKTFANLYERRLRDGEITQSEQRDWQTLLQGHGDIDSNFCINAERLTGVPKLFWKNLQKNSNKWESENEY